MSTILIIDDDSQICAIVGGYLRRHGYKVIFALDGSQGLAAAATQPDLIVCDLDMPGMDGQSLVQTIRRDPQLSEIPVVFLSACTERGRIRQSMNIGGDDFITKPAELSEILEAVTARLSRQRHRRQLVARQLDETVQLFMGIINDLDTSGTYAKWWSEMGESMYGETGMVTQRFHRFTARCAASRRKKANSDFEKTVLVQDSSRQKFLPLSQVRAFVANGEYSIVCWGDGKRFMLRKALRTWTRELPENQFVRVHRSAIVNLAFLDFVEKDGNGNKTVHIHGMNEVFPVSCRAKGAFNRVLKNFDPNPKELALA